MTATERALKLISENKITMPSQFARLMWPDNPAWKHHTRCGHGTTRGGGMRLAGGGFLGRLRKAGLVGGGGPIRYYLMPKGKELLKAIET